MEYSQADIAPPVQAGSGRTAIRAAEDPEAITQAVAVLRAGGLVAMPTETVYGLAADATNPCAVARVFEAKGRPRFNPLIAHVPDAEMAARHVEIPPLAEALISAFWPGPLTLVLPRRKGTPIADLASAGLPTLAVRAPAQETARQLIAAFGAPLVAPSANLSGHISPTRAEHVLADLDGKLDLVLDAGPCVLGVESTVVRVMPDAPVRILRPGVLTREDLEQVVRQRAVIEDDERKTESTIDSPGMLERHYAPAKPLRLDAAMPRKGEFMIGFADIGGDANLSSTGDLHEAAARLFALLREAEASDRPRIAVAPIPVEGLGLAIRDRLRRAAQAAADEGKEE